MPQRLRPERSARMGVLTDEDECALPQCLGFHEFRPPVNSFMRPQMGDPAPQGSISCRGTALRRAQPGAPLTPNPASRAAKQPPLAALRLQRNASCQCDNWYRIAGRCVSPSRTVILKTRASIPSIPCATQSLEIPVQVTLYILNFHSIHASNSVPLATEGSYL